MMHNETKTERGVWMERLPSIGVGGGGSAPAPNFWKPVIRAKRRKNSGKMREEFGQISGKKWREKIKKRQQKIRAKFRRKFGQKVEGKKITKRKQKSGKFTGREWKINCIFKSIKLFENNSQELARFYV